MIPIAAYVPSVSSSPFNFCLSFPFNTTVEYFIGNFFVLGHFSGVWLGTDLGFPIAKRETEICDSPNPGGQFAVI